MSYSGSRNMDCNGGIARFAVGQFGDKALLPDREWLHHEVYRRLFDKSRVDVIRYCNEDEWPIEEIVELTADVVRRIIGDLESEGSNYYASARNGLRRKQYEKARELGFEIKPQEEP